MSDAPDRLADAIRRWLKEEMGRSSAARDLLVQLAELVRVEADLAPPEVTDLAAAGAPALEDSGSPDAAMTAGAGVAARDVAEEPAEPVTEEPGSASVPLTLGGSSTHVRVSGSASEISQLRQAAADQQDAGEPQQDVRSPKPIDLGLIEERCRLKAESCRFFIERRTHQGDPVHEPALKTRAEAMIATAKSMPDCFLWVFWPWEAQPADQQLVEIAKCYDALAESAGLCARAVADDGRLSTSEVQQAFQVFAEATSALRVALAVTWLDSDDFDQEEAHLWLRRETQARQVFIERHMKLDDPANPEDADAIIAEARRLLATEETRIRRERRIDQLINKAAYHARRVRTGSHFEQHDIDTINGVMEELRSMGVGPTDSRVAEFRESLEGVEFPAHLPRHDYLTFESQPTNAPPDATNPPWNERVLEVRPLLEGGRIVVVGGESRPEAVSRLEDAFGASVDWVELTEHGSGARLQAPIERPDTRVVLVLIKLTGHLHSENARDYARAAGVPCVYVEAGYNPNMLAEQMMQQAGDRLRAARSPDE